MNETTSCNMLKRLLATLPCEPGPGLRRVILAVLTAFGIVLATAGVAAMPLLNAGNVVEDYESGLGLSTLSPEWSTLRDSRHPST